MSRCMCVASTRLGGGLSLNTCVVKSPGQGFEAQTCLVPGHLLYLQRSSADDFNDVSFNATSMER
jgi:hypothetical protein